MGVHIRIKGTARVMLTTNVDIADRLINGQMGTVIKIGINQNTHTPNIVYVKFDDNEAERNAMRKHSTDPFVQENQVVPIKPVLARIKLGPGKPSTPEIERTQFPLTLAYACTVHKVQGLTLQNVVISFDLIKQNSFNYGQIYVALSRSTSLQGIHILGQIEMKHIKANPKVHKEYERLRSIPLLPLCNVPFQHKSVEMKHDLAVSLLNIRSLKKHSIDIKCDANIFNSDILALTETQLLPNSTDIEIRRNLQPFALCRQDHQSDKFSSLALCTRKHIHLEHRQYFQSINAIKFTITNTVTQQNQSFLLLYRKESSNIPLYRSDMRQILNNTNIDVVLGNFNIDYLNTDECQPLKSIINSLDYVQIVQKTTFISGTLLDQIYLRPKHYNVLQNNVISTYYSNHEAVQINIQKQIE